MNFRLLFCLLVTTSSVYAVDLTPSQRCEPEIVFGSHSSGINRRAHGELMAFIADAPPGLLTAATYKRWGREGEVTYCLTLSPTATRETIEDFSAFLRDFAARANEEGANGYVVIRYDR